MWHGEACFASCCGWRSGTSPRPGFGGFGTRHASSSSIAPASTGDSSTSRGGLIPMSARPLCERGGRRARHLHSRALDSAATAGKLGGRDARHTDRGPRPLLALRLEHQVEQLRQGARARRLHRHGEARSIDAALPPRGISRGQRGAALPQGRARSFPVRLLGLRRRPSSDAARAYRRARRPPSETRGARRATRSWIWRQPASTREATRSSPLPRSRSRRPGDRRAGPHRIARPKRMPEAETIRIHGLRPIDLADAPELPRCST